jgi:hypothetical protein
MEIVFKTLFPKRIIKENNNRYIMDSEKNTTNKLMELSIKPIIPIIPNEKTKIIIKEKPNPLYECSICFGEYHLESKNWCALSCGHIYCESCAIQQQYSELKECFICRKVITFVLTLYF